MKTVLIVDDKLEVRELVEVTLRIGDYRFLHAASGPEALRIAERDRPDLVIMDIMMPGEFDGIDAVRKLKADKAFEETRIVMLTAKSGALDNQRSLEAGADSYVVKPFGPMELMRAVDEALSQSS